MRLRLHVLSLIAATLGACSGKQSIPAKPVSVPMPASLVVNTEDAPQEQIWDGTVEAVNSAILSAQTVARVKELPYDVNDVVEEGAVVVRFSDVEQRSSKRAAQAQIDSAKATYDNAEVNYQRYAAILLKGLVAKAVVDQAQAQRDAAKAALVAAQADWQQIGMQQDYTVVRAPYAGIITRRYVHVGESVQAGPPAPQPLLAIASLKDLRVTVQVPQSAIQAIRRFHTADVLLDGQGGRRVAAGKVTVFPYADPDTHTFAVRLDLSGEDTGLYPGMTVKAAFATGRTQRLLVPVSALVQRGELQGVYVLSDHGASLRQVRTGYQYGDRIDILSGLGAGERIAADPAATTRWIVESRKENAP